MKITLPYFFYAAIIDPDFSDGKHLKLVAKQDYVTLNVDTYRPALLTPARRFEFEARRRKSQTPDALVYLHEGRTFVNHSWPHDFEHFAIEGLAHDSKPPISLNALLHDYKRQVEAIIHKANNTPGLRPGEYAELPVFERALSAILPSELSWQRELLFAPSQTDNIWLSLPGDRHDQAEVLVNDRSQRISAIKNQAAALLFPTDPNATVLHQIPDQLFYKVGALYSVARISVSPVFSNTLTAPTSYNPQELMESPVEFNIPEKDLEQVLELLLEAYDKDDDISLPENRRDCITFHVKSLPVDGHRQHQCEVKQAC